MAYRIERSITIAAPARVVWETVQDVSRRTEWDARVIACETVTTGPFGKGSQARIGYNLFGLRMEVVMEMVAWSPPRKSAAKAHPNPMGSLAGSWYFEEHPDGSTTFTTKIVIRCETGILRALRERLLGGYMDRLTGLSQARLRRLVEAEHSAAGNMASGSTRPTPRGLTRSCTCWSRHSGRRGADPPRRPGASPGITGVAVCSCSSPS